MPRNSRIEHYTSSEGELTRQLQRMRALGIGGQFTALPSFSVWSRESDKKKRQNIIDHAKRDNARAIEQAEKNAAAAAASGAGSSHAGPSVRDRSNSRSPMLAALTPRRLAQRTASVTALARTLRCAPKTLTELVDEAAEDNRSQTLSRIDAKVLPARRGGGGVAAISRAAAAKGGEPRRGG